MKKVVCLFMICLLASFFGLGSDALAKKKITAETLANTEWEVSGTGKYYSCETAENPGGEYLGSMIGAVGLAIFSGTEVVGTIAPMVVTGGGVIVGASGTFILSDYTLSGNKLRSTEGSISIDLPGMPGFEDYSGPMEAVLKFTKKGTFTGTVKYINFIKCEDNVITFSGKMMGQFPSDDPE